jgi:MFS family permease
MEGDVSAPARAAGFLSRERIIAGPHFNRWMVPPAALAIHLSIGMVYGFSIFWLPLTRAVGITESVACSPELSFLQTLTARHCDWKISWLAVTFTLFFVFLGGSTALFGGWLERVGPRKTAVVAAFCWSGGLVLSALAVATHQIWLMWLGTGVIGGVGLGLAYISPMATLLRWFPDRRGLATGMAVMGFGGGALVGAPLAHFLISSFATPNSVGMWQTFLAMAAIYFVFMMGGALGYRVPPRNWRPPGGFHNFVERRKSTRQVHADVAWKTPQFWLIWSVLCLNVLAGTGVLGVASPMLQEMFGGRLMGITAGEALTDGQKLEIAGIGVGFVGFLSLFNIGGRIVWAALSDRIGRKATFTLYSLLGFAFYASAPLWAKSGALALFVLSVGMILSIFGGAFASVPAYLADLFGTKMVSAIYGRLLTAWAVAGLLGPMLVNNIREYQLDHGIPRAQAYDVTLYILAALQLIGCVCNYFVKPVPPSRCMTEDELGRRSPTPAAAPAEPPAAVPALRQPLLRLAALVLAWVSVGGPLAYGIWRTVESSSRLFR